MPHSLTNTNRTNRRRTEDAYRARNVHFAYAAFDSACGRNGERVRSTTVAADATCPDCVAMIPAIAAARASVTLLRAGSEYRILADGAIAATANDEAAAVRAARVLRRERIEAARSAALLATRVAKAA